ncbi:MAG TPA: DedA family protein [Usitatibacteraceae bacterium]|nr:DedA family protein [Usitatibacteraceae bacterium]
MDIPGLIDQYGYLAVVVGAFLEGETVIALAGFAAHRGYLDFAAVAALAGLAGFAGDQFYFFLGRYRGAQVLARFPGAQAKAQRVDDMLARWHAPFIVMLRFMYGFRIAGPVLLGVGQCPAWKFVVFNAIGAALWAPAVAGAGWVFGEAAQRVLADIRNYEGWLFAAIVLAGLAGVAIHRFRRRS